jgi:hypothetical protein
MKDKSDCVAALTRGVKKNRGTGTGTGKPENRKPGNRGPGSGLEKPKTGYPGSGTRFLVPGFYRVTGNRVKYIYILYFIYIFLVRALDV